MRLVGESESLLQEHPDVARGKQLGVLKESMLEGSPFPKLHAKAAETKALVKAVSDALLHFADQDASQRPLLDAMIAVLEDSHAIDVVVDGMNDFNVRPDQAKVLQVLVHRLNVGTTKLCHNFIQKGQYLFNFLPKNHMLYHIAQLGQHMSPKLAWCYKGEDLMQKVKILAQGSFRGCSPKILGNKVLAKYMVGLAQALADTE